MPNAYFKFKEFTVYQDRSAMKVTTDSCLFGAWIAQDLSESKEKFTMLDIGAGTGLLSLMVAQKNNAWIDAVEIDKEAAIQAAENIASSHWPERIRVIHENIIDHKTAGLYNVIISNPPFYENELASPNKEKNKAHHSTELSLRQLFEVFYNNLDEQGVFYILLPFKREKEAEALLEEFHFHVSKKIMVSPSPVHQPSRIMMRGSKNNSSALEVSGLLIKDDEQEYSSAFTELLKDYYLYL